MLLGSLETYNPITNVHNSIVVCVTMHTFDFRTFLSPLIRNPTG